MNISLEFTRTSGYAGDGIADDSYLGLTSGGGGGAAASPAYRRFENGAANAAATGAGSIMMTGSRPR